MFKAGDLVYTRHGISKISNLTADGNRAYFEEFLCYQDLKDISFVFLINSWVVAQHQKNGKCYQPFQYSKNQKVANGYNLIPWVPLEDEWVWIPKKMIPVKINKIIEDDYFVSNLGVGFESKVFIKDLAPFVDKIPDWLMD